MEDLEDAAGAGEGSDGAEAQLELLRGRINELEEELDIERMKCVFLFVGLLCVEVVYSIVTLLQSERNGRREGSLERRDHGL